MSEAPQNDSYTASAAAAILNLSKRRVLQMLEGGEPRGLERLLEAASTTQSASEPHNDPVPRSGALRRKSSYETPLCNIMSARNV